MSTGKKEGRDRTRPSLFAAWDELRRQDDEAREQVLEAARKVERELHLFDERLLTRE